MDRPPPLTHTQTHTHTHTHTVRRWTGVKWLLFCFVESAKETICAIPTVLSVSDATRESRFRRDRMNTEDRCKALGAHKSTPNHTEQTTEAEV